MGTLVVLLLFIAITWAIILVRHTKMLNEERQYRKKGRQTVIELLALGMTLDEIEEKTQTLVESAFLDGVKEQIAAFKGQAAVEAQSEVDTMLQRIAKSESESR